MLGIRLLVAGCLFFLSPLSLMATDWRGLIPLRSSRIDVVKTARPTIEFGRTNEFI